MCPQCRHGLQARDLIPVLSWLELRGRCRYCQARISWQYPFVELLTAGGFVVSYWQWPYELSGASTLAFAVWLVTLVMLIALVVYDIRWMLLPNRLIYPVTIASLLLVGLVAFHNESWSVVVGAGLGALLLSGLFWGLFQISGGKWIGGGDVKLAVSLGLLAGGLLDSILLLFIASLLGSLVSLPLLARHKQASHKVPFGPFLITSAIIVFFWGSVIINWYTQLIGV